METLPTVGRQSSHHRKGNTMYKTNSIHKLLFIFVAALIIAALPNMHASAAFRTCRSDPIFKLSNGDVINVTLDIGTDEASVKNVTYVLHVPTGVTVTKVTYTAGGIGKKEMYKVVQDSPLKTYTTDTVVTTQNTGSVAIVATTRLNSIFAQSASGVNGEHLIITVVKS
jgi:hypothetical protein